MIGMDVSSVEGWARFGLGFVGMVNVDQSFPLNVDLQHYKYYKVN